MLFPSASDQPTLLVDSKTRPLIYSKGNRTILMLLTEEHISPKGIDPYQPHNVDVSVKLEFYEMTKGKPILSTERIMWELKDSYAGHARPIPIWHYGVALDPNERKAFVVSTVQFLSAIGIQFYEVDLSIFEEPEETSVQKAFGDQPVDRVIIKPLENRVNTLCFSKRKACPARRNPFQPHR